MSKSNEQWLFLQDVALLIMEAKRLGIKLTGGELYRTEYQQAKYFADGKSKTMNSMHLKKLAVDFNFFIGGQLTYKKEDIQPLGDYWESLDYKNEWGGNWKSFQDVPHFQRNE